MTPRNKWVFIMYGEVEKKMPLAIIRLCGLTPRRPPKKYTYTDISTHLVSQKHMARLG